MRRVIGAWPLDLPLKLHLSYAYVVVILVGNKSLTNGQNN